MNKIKLLNIEKIIQNETIQNETIQNETIQNETIQNETIQNETIQNKTILNDDYAIVQKFEDEFAELYKTDNNSRIIDEDVSILYDITENNNFNIKIYSKPNISLFNLEPELLEQLDKFVLGGSYIRSSFVNDNLVSDIDLELHLYPLAQIDLEKLSTSYVETPTMFYKKVLNYIVYINKELSKSIGEVLLNNTYIKRCVYHNGLLYVSPMFILEYNLNKNFISTNMVEPIFKTRIDLFGIYPTRTIRTETIFDLINLKDYESFKSKLKLNFTERYNDLSSIEYALRLFFDENCLIIKEQLKLIISDLFTMHKFIRPPAFFANLIGIKDIDIDLYESLCDETYLTISANASYTNLSEINDIILQHYIKLDDDDKFYSYIDFLKKRLSGNIIDYLIRFKPEKIIKRGIKKQLFSQHHIYRIILESEELQHFLTMKTMKTMKTIKSSELELQTMMNYIDTIISHSLSKSFFYIYKIDPSITSYEDSEQNTILHKLSEEKFNDTFLNLILTLDENLLRKKNSLGETPLLSHAKKQNMNITSLLLQYIMHNNLDSMLSDKDDNGDTIFHLLAKSDTNVHLFKLFINSPSTKLIINKQNSSKQTPIMLSTINFAENIFYLLQTANADTSVRDAYSNSIYHYICLNEMCIGMAIEDKPNIFGYKPSDYCKISKTYYYFI